MKALSILFVLFMLIGCSNNSSSSYVSIDYTKENRVDVLYDLDVKDIAKVYFTYKVVQEDKYNELYNLIDVEYEYYYFDNYYDIEASSDSITFYVDESRYKLFYIYEDHLVFRMFRVNDNYKVIEYSYKSIEKVDLTNFANNENNFINKKD